MHEVMRSSLLVARQGFVERLGADQGRTKAPHHLSEHVHEKNHPEKQALGTTDMAGALIDPVMPAESWEFVCTFQEVDVIQVELLGCSPLCLVIASTHAISYADNWLDTERYSERGYEVTKSLAVVKATFGGFI